MSAPERIWACHASYDGRLIGMHDGEISGWDEYVRADLVQALVAEAMKRALYATRDRTWSGVEALISDPAALRAIWEGGE